MAVARFSKQPDPLPSVVPRSGGEVRLCEGEAGLSDALEAGAPQKVACRRLAASAAALPFIQEFLLCVRSPPEKSDGDSDA
jgi:hypothetical protein